MIPTTIKVGPQHWSVHTEGIAIAEARYDHSSPGAIGQAIPKKLEIALDPLLPYDLMAESLVHEVLHCLHWIAGFYNSDAKVEVHDFIRRIAPLLLGVIRDNPQLMEFLERPNTLRET